MADVHGPLQSWCLPYKRLLEDGKLIECGMTPNDVPMLGTKYYCFDAIERKGIAAEGPCEFKKTPVTKPGPLPGHKGCTSWAEPVP